MDAVDSDVEAKRGHDGSCSCPLANDPNAPTQDLGRGVFAGSG
jgi:hypothetical protein